MLVCFVEGTLVETDLGLVDVQQLEIGDWVKTADHGYQPLRSCLKKHVDVNALADEKLRPVRITAGSLGHGLPNRDLLVSRQHRMVVFSKICERMFGVREAMVPAIRLIELPGIFIDNQRKAVTYHHLVFDQHEVIFAEGAPTESFYPGPVGLAAISPEAKQEICALFPELSCEETELEASRFMPPAKQQKTLIQRHLKNTKAICAERQLEVDSMMVREFS